MDNRFPDIDESTLERITQDALYDLGYKDKDIYDIMKPLYKAGVFDLLEEHIQKEIDNPSVKGPGPEWRKRN